MSFPWALWLCRFVQTSAAVLLAGTAALRLLATGTGLDPAKAGWRDLVWASALALLAAAVWQFALTVAEMSGQPLAQALADGSARVVLDGTLFGTIWKGRVALAGGALVLAGISAGPPRSNRRPGVVLDGATALLSAALLGSLVLAGHAQASERSAWLLPAGVIHAAAAGAWPGGLLPLALLLGRVRRDPSLRPRAVVIVRRFSRLSATAVAILVLSGVVNGAGMIHAPGALWTSAYGRLVLCKVALLVPMVALGAANRRLVRRPLAADAPATLRLLWRNVAAESLLAVGVLLATEALGTGAPPVVKGL